MSDWWTYRPEDFLLFSPRVYWRMFELQNEALWPLPILAGLAGIAMLAATAFRPGRHGLWIGLALAALWAFVGWSFVWNRYAAINWAMAYVAPVFALQALLVALGAARGWLCRGTAPPFRPALLLLAVAVVLYPLLPLVSDRPLSAAEILGIAPDPTAIATIGLALAAGRAALLLLPIPLVWLASSGLTLQTMGESQAWLPFAAVVATPLILVMRRRL